MILYCPKFNEILQSQDSGGPFLGGQHFVYPRVLYLYGKFKGPSAYYL